MGRLQRYQQDKAASADRAASMRRGPLAQGFNNVTKANALLGDATQHQMVGQVEQATFLPDSGDLAEDLSRTPDSRAADVVLQAERTVQMEQTMGKIMDATVAETVADLPENQDKPDPRQDLSRDVEQRTEDILRAEQARIDRENGDA